MQQSRGVGGTASGICCLPGENQPAPGLEGCSCIPEQAETRADRACRTLRWVGTPALPQLRPSMTATSEPPRIPDTTRLLHDLEPVVTENLHRHLAAAKEWMPHEYVPWSLGRDYADLGGAPWDPEQSRLSPIAQTALEVNLLTEDNLPSYHREIGRTFGRDGAWGTWVHRWTAEEGRHAYCIRDYLLVTRGVDPVELERARMQVMQTGYDTQEAPLLRILAYVSFQELATRISHRNTGRHAGDPIAERLLTRVSTDENLHMVFYRNLAKAALDLCPGPALRAITDEAINFNMPGIVIPGFARKAAQ